MQGAQVRFLFLCFRLGISHSLRRNMKRGFLFMCESDVEVTRKEECPIRLDVKKDWGGE